MQNYTIIKRTFKAKNYPKGSLERQKLNTDATTSEYMPTYKWLVNLKQEEDTKYGERNTTKQFKTLKEARQFCLYLIKN